MKIVAHPLVVAVALGLLAPPALEAQASEGPAPCLDCDDDAAEPQAWEPSEAPSAEDFHRVELAYAKLSDREFGV